MLINELPSFEVQDLHPLMDLIDEYLELEEVQNFLSKYQVPFKEVNSVGELTVKCQRVGLWFIGLKNINNTGIFGSIVVTGSNISLTLKSFEYFKNKNGKIKHFKDYNAFRFVGYLEVFLEPFKPLNIAGFASPLRSFEEGITFSISGDFLGLTITGKCGYYCLYTKDNTSSMFILSEVSYGC